MKNRTVVNLGTVRPNLSELEKARTAVMASEFDEFHRAAMRAILLMSAAKMSEEQAPSLRVSGM